MDQTSSAVRRFRTVVFVLTAGMLLYKITTVSWEQFAGPFRFLTIWGLTASTISAWFMLRLSMGWSASRREVFASVTVVLNLTVLAMYWKIYLEDPTALYRDGNEPQPWYDEYFLHGLGPALQIFDALVILGAFTKLRQTFAVVLALPIFYISWMELVLRPLNSKPSGSVTSGLPYPFLNDLILVPGRLTFYITTVVTMLVLAAIAAGMAWLIRRSRSPKGAASP